MEIMVAQRERERERERRVWNLKRGERGREINKRGGGREVGGGNGGRRVVAQKCGLADVWVRGSCMPNSPSKP